MVLTVTFAFGSSSLEHDVKSVYGSEGGHH